MLTKSRRPIAFHPTSVLFETSNHAELLEKTGVRDLVSDVIDELVNLAEARNCSFAPSFKTTIMEEMIGPQGTNSIMYQDYAARRPMEVETYLGNPIDLAKDKSIKLPRIETLYALLHHINIANQKRQATVPDQPPTPSATPRAMGPPPPRGPSMNGPMPPPPGGGPPPGMRTRGSRAPSLNGPPPPPMRRGLPGPNGYPPPGGMPPRGHHPLQRRPSFESNGLDEFSHLVIYDQPGDGLGGGGPASNGYVDPGSDMDMRERELVLRQKELALREREMNMPPRGHGPPRQRPPQSRLEDFDEEDGEDDYFDPMAHRGPAIDPDNVDMMSITSRRNRKQPSVGQLRQNPEGAGRPAQRRSNPFGRNNRQSTRMMMNETPGLHENPLDNPMMGYSSDRYGGLDRSKLAREGRDSRTSSLTTARLNELGGGGASYGAYPPVASRRTSQSPATPLSPGGPGMRQGPSPPGNGYGPSRASPNGPLNGPPNGAPNGRPSPPDMRQPTPRYPPGHGNSVAPQQVENRAGVSNLNPPKKSAPQVRSLTGSASASAGSGDSGQSAQVSHENSAYSSQSSLGPRPPVGIR